MSVPTTMSAVLLTGHGGIEKLEFRTDVAVPTPGLDEVLINVRAAAVNNTDINTRVGWYSKAVTEATEAGGAGGFANTEDADASWSGVELGFPRIQGADACGVIVAVGDGVDSRRIGERVLVRNMLRTYVDYRPFECWTFGSECDGGFAQFTVAPARESYAVNSEWSDEKLAAVPCAYSTAENMIHQAQVSERQRVLITGASGGVGLAAVQLAKRRGAHVIAISSAAKADLVREQGADEVIDRGVDPAASLAEPVDVVIDVVGGQDINARLGAMRRGGVYTLAGAIAGPIAEINLRTIYLNDLRLLGCTFQEDIVFENLIRYIEANEIDPQISKVHPLRDIAQAQEDFLSKSYAGKIALIPDPVN